MNSEYQTPHPDPLVKENNSLVKTWIIPKYMPANSGIIITYNT